MASDRFEYLVLGDEPTGLWLLGKLGQVFLESGHSERLGWINFAATPAPTFFPSIFAPAFGISPTFEWSAEIVTPKRSFLWERDLLIAQYPTVAPFLQMEFSNSLPQTKNLKELAQVIRKHPELLGFCTGVWKVFGRTERLQPENLVWGALMCTKLFWWSPIAQLPANIERIRVKETRGILEEIKWGKRGEIQVQFRGMAPLVTRRLIINTSLLRLMQLPHKGFDLLRWLNVDTQMMAANAQFPFRLIAGNEAIPSPVRPLTLYFDSEEIPEPETEIWPIQRISYTDAQDLQFWVTARRESSLESYIEKFRSGMQRMNHLFPFLSQYVKHFSLPLYSDSCISDEYRNSLTEAIEDSCVELYGLTSLQWQTRSPNLFILGPFLNCHLPYPLGPMQAAQKLLLDLMVQHRNTQTKPHPPEPDSPPPN